MNVMRFEDTGKLMLRLVTFVVMLPHGLAKFKSGHMEVKQILESQGFPSFLWVGVPFAEFLAPILLLVGIWTRPAAIVLAFNMLMTIYLVFRHSLFSLNVYGGIGYELNLMLLFVSVAVACLGAGRYSFCRGRGLYQ